ncbi:MAG: hypothetical protein PUF50_03785 [Erysipelotrichaceae bacterium]|nr:hypothetical protein [Erysipelotrichaceae bacterium]
MRVLQRRKWMIVIIVVIVMIGLGKGCMNQANKELLQSVSLTTAELGQYEKKYQTMGKVMPKQSLHQPIEGSIIRQYVKEGDMVKKNDPLLKYQWQDQEKTLKAKQDGVVYAITSMDVEIVSLDSLWIWFEVPQAVKDELQLQQKVQVNQKTAEICSISNLSSHENENYYDVYACFDEKESLFLHQEVEVELLSFQKEEVYLLPLNAVIEQNGHSYVVMEQWTKHPMELRLEDYIEVTVIGMQDGKVVVKKNVQLQQPVCLFSSLSYSFIQELIRVYD